MKLAFILLLCMGNGLCFAQTPFKHIKHNHKLRTSAQQEERTKTPVNTLSPANRQQASPDLHPVRLKHQKVAQQRHRRRQRTAPQTQSFSSQKLYLEIKSGEGMENQKAQNRKMWSGK